MIETVSLEQADDAYARMMQGTVLVKKGVA